MNLTTIIATALAIDLITGLITQSEVLMRPRLWAINLGNRFPFLLPFRALTCTYCFSFWVAFAAIPLYLWAPTELLTPMVAGMAALRLSHLVQSFITGQPHVEAPEEGWPPEIPESESYLDRRAD